MNKDKAAASILFHSVNYLVFLVFTLLCIYPFYYIFINTLSNPQESAKGTVFLIPAAFTLENYAVVFKLEGIFNAFAVSALRAVVGTLITLFFSSMLGYVLTKKELFLRKIIYRLAVISMYLSVGLIPWYITMKTLGLKNSFLLYVLPGAVSAFSVILIKTYIEQIPPSLEESALIDGAGSFTIFLHIIIPLSMPIIAAVAVFSAVGQWNSWGDNFFLVSKKNLQTLQMVLLRLLQQSDSIARQTNKDLKTISEITITPSSVRMTITMVCAIPIILVYPMLQRYFVKGIMLGAVKG